MGRGRARIAALGALAALGVSAPAAAHLPAGRQAPPALGVDPIGATMPMPLRDEPPLTSTPAAGCPGDDPLSGRVSAATIAAGGASCRITKVGAHGRTGGYKVLRYVDRAGRECAYYDSTLLFPLNALTLSAQRTTGVVVLDMSDPARPRQTATLASPAMLTPHESLELNARRGLLAAVMGSPAFNAGHLDVYDLVDDCRHPKLLASAPVGLLGHESGFAPDGRTFYATSIGGGTITAIDLDNPRLPVPLWVGHVNSHGLSVSDDGRRAYVAARQGLMVLDTSEIQARRPGPKVTLVGGVRWAAMTIPQIAIPVTIRGRPYVVEVDEFSHDAENEAGAPGTRVARHGERVGAVRIIDMADERAPRVVANVRLDVHQPEHRPAVAGDPGADGALQGYAAHYCDVPRRKEPGLLACSFIASGLRLFDIRDPRAPREVAYWARSAGQLTPRSPASNWAMSRPAFAPARKELWYTDAGGGFFALRVDDDAWRTP